MNMRSGTRIKRNVRNEAGMNGIGGAAGYSEDCASSANKKYHTTKDC